MKLPVLNFIFLCSAVLYGYEDLGPLETARSNNPQIFQTGSVNIITINNIPCYVFSGDAEQAFSGDFAETESELYEEAAFAAKSRFYEYLSKKNKKAVVHMTGCEVLYRYNDKKFYNVILFVPQANVTIKMDGEPRGAVDEQKKSEADTETILPSPLSPVSSSASSSIEQQTSEDKSLAPNISSINRRIAKFENRIKNNSNDVFAIIALADLYKNTGKLPEAAEFYCSAVQKIYHDKFFDESEKIRVIYEVASLYEQLNYHGMALKYYNYLLKHECTLEQKESAVAAISRIRLKMLH